LVKLIMIRIIRKYHNFRGSLQCSQGHAVGYDTVLDSCVLFYYSVMINDPFSYDIICAEVFLLVFLNKIRLLQLSYPCGFILPYYERPSSTPIPNNT
jgi:hypothetical protein